MPGFRPGKVPASVVKARFGDQAKGDVIRTALDDGAKEAIEGNPFALQASHQLILKNMKMAVIWKPS